MPTYSELNERNPGADPVRLRQLEALYEGGQKLEALYGILLPRRDRERESRYQLRLKEAQYRNYLGPIIDYFRSMLFVSRPILKAKKDGADSPTANAGDYWNALREDCDGGGTDLDALYGQVLTDAMVGRIGWIRARLPDDGLPEPINASEFEQRKLGDATLERVEPCDILDWDDDGKGRLAWAITHKREQRRNGLSGGRKLVVETWEYLTPESVEVFQITWDADKKPAPEQEVPSLGGPKPHRFGAVPLFCLDLPPALWVANRLQSAQLAHFRKVNAQAWSLAATCYATREYFVKDPAEFEKVVMGAGYDVVLNQEDKAQWSAPPGEHFSALDNEIKAEKDEIFRVAHQMALGVENNAAAVGRSADSKASDSEVTRVVLIAFSRKVKEAIERALDLIAHARGEKIEWSVEGLDDFAAFDIGAFMMQLGLSVKAGPIMSRTFKVQEQIRRAESLLKDADEETKAKIRKEIEAGTTDPAVDAELDRQAARDVFAAPPGDRRPGADPPAKPPRANPDSGRAEGGQRPPNGKA